MKRCVKPKFCSIKAMHALNLQPCALLGEKKLNRLFWRVAPGAAQCCLSFRSLTIERPALAAEAAWSGPALAKVSFATNEMVIWSVGPEQELAVSFYAWRTITLSTR